MSNPLKKVGKAVGKVFKKVGKFVKKNWKPILAVAAIYFGGAALGMWGSGAQTGTALSGATSAAGPGSGLISGSLSSVAPNTAATMGNLSSTLGTASSGLAGPSPLASTLASAQSSAAANAAAQLTGKELMVGGIKAGMQKVGEQEVAKSLLSRAANSVLGFVDKHPGGAMMLGQTLSSAFTPSEDEIQAKIEANRRRNSTYFGVPGSAGISPGTDLAGLFKVQPAGGGGLVNRNMQQG